MSGLRQKFNLFWLVVLSCTLAISVPYRTYADNSDFKPSQRIGSAVYNELQGSHDGRAYVIVLLEKPLVAADVTLDERHNAVRQVQDNVLQRFEPGEFSIVHKYNNFSSMTGYVNQAGLAKLAADPQVKAVGPDVGGRAHLDDSVPFINADDVHSMVGLGYTGKGITVAVLDTGIDSDHPDLRDNIADGWYHYLAWKKGVTWVTDYGSGAEDDQGHGTNVAGIITSRGIVSSVGVAPDADILAIKVLDANGCFGRTSEIAKAVDYVIDHQDDYDNLSIINVSLGTCKLFSQCPCDNAYLDDPNYAWLRTLRDSFNAAKDAGIVIFASSGNNGKCTQMPAPACLSAATAVAAVYDQDLGREPNSGTYYNFFCGSGCLCDDCSLCPTCYEATTYGDLIACFSNLNGCNELAAPGRNITSSGKGGGLSTYTGTSQASPHCAAVAALMHEKASYFMFWPFPSYIVQCMKDTGVATVDPYMTSPNPIRVDAFRAVNEFMEPWVGFKYEQMPNKSGYGMDIRYDRRGGVQRVLADDFLCTASGPITLVTLFSSWEGDSKVSINRFHLRIYDDIPDPDGGGPEYSKPGDLLWEKDFYSAYGDFTESLYYTIPPATYPSAAWWWDPAGGQLPVSGDDKKTWQYDLPIAPTEAFVQQGDPCEPVVYWLGVHVYFTVFIPMSTDSDSGFGWKTALLTEGWNDAAVYSNDDGSTWNRLVYPMGHSYIGNPVDFAFRIFGKLCCNCANYNYDGIINFEDYADLTNNWLWSGPSGDRDFVYDLNCDGSVDFYDLRIFARQWLLNCMDECRYCY